jgi:2-C-methyl-D-erythritol 4-phosphate cytidylyltransferase
MSIGMIVLAGGIGKRMGKPSPKQYALLGGKPIIMHTLEKVEHLSAVDTVIITCPAEYLDATQALLENHDLTQFRCIEGGETRQDSVYEGLRALSDHETVLIHEAVRPFVTLDEFRALIADPHENAIYGAPVPFTVLRGHDSVEGTLDRRELVNVQLPQKFKTSDLLTAHKRARAEGHVSTEDASLLYHYTGDEIAILEGSDINIKITHPADMVIGEAIYEQYVLGKA